MSTLSLLPLHAQSTPNLRSFQNPQGVVIEGEIVEWREDRVKVRRANQTIVEIPFHLLIPEQAEQLRKEASQRQGYPRAPSPQDISSLLQTVSTQSPAKVYQDIRERLMLSYPAQFEYNEPWLWIAYWMDLIARSNTQPPESLLRTLLSQPDWSRQFFSLWSADDKPAPFMKILVSLSQQFPEDFSNYLGLALATALVHDSSPPLDWPHSQVSRDILPRQLQPYDQVFQFLVESQKERRLENDLTRLSLQDLLFLVDIIAPIEELKWAQQNVRERTPSFSKVYSNIRYDRERVDFRRGHFQPYWPHRSYSLENIQERGGICVDQAYFTWQAGKAKGIPTILFVGHGNEGSHAWIGYLQGNRGWNLDVGRYSQERFVTGTAFSPQNWRQIKDHELVFLRERFQDGTSFKESSYHLNIARWFTDDKQYSQSEHAANTSLKLEPRNAQSWNLLRSLSSLQGNKEGEKKVLIDAMGTLNRFPDWHNHFRMELTRWWIQQGNPEEAFREWQLLIRRQLNDRPDLAVLNMAEFLIDMHPKLSSADFERYTKRSLSQAGKKIPDMIAVQDLLYPVCRDLLQSGKPDEALSLIRTFKDAFKPAPDSQASYVISNMEDSLSGRSR